MSLVEALRNAFDGIASNKLRSFLTMLGVVIGVAAVIALVSVADGATKMMTQRIEAMGTNLIIINSRSPEGLTLEQLDGLLERVPTVRAVAPEINTYGTVKWGLNSFETQILGAGSSYLTVRNRELAYGRWISQNDVDFNRRVAVVGDGLVTELFVGRDPVGQQILVYGQEFTVIGVLEKQGDLMGMRPDHLVAIPITSAQRLLGNTRLSTVYAQLTDPDAAEMTTAHLEAIFTWEYGRPDMVFIQSQDQLLESISEANRTAALMLGAIAGISLLVGGIGIMNIMLVSVTERTREIGLRKAVGARRPSIMLQFLIESLAISLTGGLFGVLVGTGLSRAAANFGQFPTSVSANSVGISVGFAAAVGLIFGLYPAFKAARLDPIRALRYE